MGIKRHDCQKIMSVLWHQEEIRTKKRRWISGDSTLSVDSEKTLKKLKFLPESLLRRSQVIENSLGLTLQESYHVVQEFVRLFDPQTIENPVIFQKNTSFLLNNLKTEALNCVLDIFREININIERNTIPRKSIEEIIPKIFLFFKSNNYSDIVKKLAEVFRDPINYRNPMKLTTIVNAQLISSIRKTLEQVDHMPIQALVAIKRKLNCVHVVPKIPVCTVGKQERLVSQLKKACDEILYVLEEGEELPAPFAKALSVILLSIKLCLRKPDIQTSVFFPFNPEVVALQDEILRAIWTIPKVKTAELKTLRCLVDPTSKLKLRKFQKAVIKYLTEFLFECDDIDIPKLLVEVLSFINRKSKRHLDFVIEVSNKDEMEHVMNISAHLREIVRYSFSADDVGQTLSDAFDLVDEYHSDDGDDIIIDDNNAFDGPGSFTEDIIEGTGDSEPVDLFAAQVSRSSQGQRNGKATESPQDMNITACSPSARKTSGSHNVPTSLRIETVCDETAVFAYQIIDQVLEGLMETGGYVNHTREKHTGFVDSKKIDVLDSMGPSLLAQTVEKLAPNFSRSGLEKMKKLMGLF